MNCTRCEATGFINIEHGPEEILEKDAHEILKWIDANPDTEVSVCDCCGNTGEWYGEPGQHYVGGDRQGPNGQYAYNGGLSECH